MSRSQSILDKINLTDEERLWFDQKNQHPHLSFKINSYYGDLAIKKKSLRAQCIPQIQEFDFLDTESPDPLSEQRFSPVPRLVHRYLNRVVVLVTDHCEVHCRHCFRRSFTGHSHPVLSDQQIEPMVYYLKNHPEVKEILFTGGDPLSHNIKVIQRVLRMFREVSDTLVFRIGTRIPVVAPHLISSELVDFLKSIGPLWLITQFNHSDELTLESKRALRTLVDGGIPLLNQSVLLRGVNDNPSTLAELFNSLVALRVKPYYLFQGDLARGTSHFRVPLKQAWDIVDQLRPLVSGIGMPVFAVDLPGGGGKIPIERSHFIKEGPQGYEFLSLDGQIYTYPKEGD